eukprot:scaffold4850_cov213-Pinguiococcus_pyrenoidosus.AAC.30
MEITMMPARRNGLAAVSRRRGSAFRKLYRFSLRRGFRRKTRRKASRTSRRRKTSWRPSGTCRRPRTENGNCMVAG